MTAALLESLSELVRGIVREELRDTLRSQDVPVRLLSVREASDAMGCGRSAMYDLMATGRLRSVKIGRRRLIPSDAIAEYIASGEQR